MTELEWMNKQDRRIRRIELLLDYIAYYATPNTAPIERPVIEPKEIRELLEQIKGEIK